MEKNKNGSSEGQNKKVLKNDYVENLLVFFFMLVGAMALVAWSTIKHEKAMAFEEKYEDKVRSMEDDRIEKELNVMDLMEDFTHRDRAKAKLENWTLGDTREDFKTETRKRSFKNDLPEIFIALIIFGFYGVMFYNFFSVVEAAENLKPKKKKRNIYVIEAYELI